MKHAQATEVSIRVKRSQQLVTMTIEDNGRGFTRMLTPLRRPTADSA